MSEEVKQFLRDKLVERADRLQAENERLTRERQEFSDALTHIENNYPDGLRVVAAALAGNVSPDPAVVAAAIARVRSRVEHDAAELSAARATLDALNELSFGIVVDADHVEHIVHSHGPKDVEANYRWLASKVVEMQAILWKFYEPIMERGEALAERLGDLHALRAEIEAARSHPEDEAEFHRLVQRMMALTGMTTDDLAREFEMSRPSAARWSNGRSAPHPAMRPPVYEALLRRISAILGERS